MGSSFKQLSALGFLFFCFMGFFWSVKWTNSIICPLRCFLALPCFNSMDMTVRRPRVSGVWWIWSRLLMGCWGYGAKWHCDQSSVGDDFLYILSWMELISICTLVCTNKLWIWSFWSKPTTHRTETTKGKGERRGNKDRILWHLFAVAAMWGGGYSIEQLQDLGKFVNLSKSPFPR